MSADWNQPEPHAIPTFSECVIGFRAWRADDRDQLWPVYSRRSPWLPGANTARCNCRTLNTLDFEWSVDEQGRRVLRPAPLHPAPETSCTCGLYSWRHPLASWYVAPMLSSPPRVVGAVASWGRIQVHDDGYRAERSCIVALAFHEAITADHREILQRIGARYRVEVVALRELAQAASRHGAPLPDTVRPPARQRSPQPDPPTRAAQRRRGPAGLASDQPVGVSARSGISGNPLLGPRRRLGLRGRVIFLGVETFIAIAFALLVLTTFNNEATTSFLQNHGRRVPGRVQFSELELICGPGYPSGQTCLRGTAVTVRLAIPVAGVRSVAIHYTHRLDLHRGQAVQVALDPHHPKRAELLGYPRAASGIWVLAAVLAAAAALVVVIDSRGVLRLARARLRTLS